MDKTFELPVNVSAKKFIAKIDRKFSYVVENHAYAIKTYYDSFDWRLYDHQLMLEFFHSQKKSEIKLIKTKKEEIVASSEINVVPKFWQEFPEGNIKELLKKSIEIRALLAQCQLEYDEYQINILNNNEKIIVRIYIEEYALINNRLKIETLKGYEKEAEKFESKIKDLIEIQVPEASVLKQALKIQARKPKEYTSKSIIKISKDISAYDASLVIYKKLLKEMQINEAGTIDDIDTEFLHDFRVAVRRTRAALSQIKNTLPANVVNETKSFFLWIGQITSVTRDMDVYLLSFEQYREALPVSLQNELTPLYEYIYKKKIEAHEKLVKQLRGDEYQKKLLKWENFLNTSKLEYQHGSQANISIKELADQRIWKVYTTLLRDAEKIHDNSEPHELHDLRKVCKKLRYLLEFFYCLYPEHVIKKIIKNLKGFQNVLGDFQDYEVQEINIKTFSQEMMADGVSSNTLLAMGVLVQHLDTLKCKARTDFANQFMLFSQNTNKTLYKNLFKN